MSIDAAAVVHWCRSVRICTYVAPKGTPFVDVPPYYTMTPTARGLPWSVLEPMEQMLLSEGGPIAEGEGSREGVMRNE